jgi:hypothetical protein
VRKKTAGEKDMLNIQLEPNVDPFAYSMDM